MGVPHHLVCELRILEAKNIELKSHGNLFIRYYLPAGNNNKIQLNTKQISTNSSSQIIMWNEFFSLECSASDESVNHLKQQTLVFELRRRRKLGKSVVLGRAEMPWKAVFESPNMEVDQCWLTLVTMNDGDVEAGVKPPSIRVSMKLVRCPAMAEIEKQKKRKQRMKKNYDGCGCQGIDGGCNCAADYEIFAIAAAMEGLV
ncbi:Peroxisomal membrane ABC transporter family, PMP family isoform 1 [Hibiscus syriacus]|uniref:Peroxisomal membrane ABC transporter family, PMP family isoform 1 n=1 Tax=Hibiscus syriacus TaxID=106335 RepID=A0A6A2ZYQ1_HIBSY|nr:Peroxisomal membrane ABC transporter family, PMP family isoform 1 [Hibiscus syriacus]